MIGPGAASTDYERERQRKAKLAEAWDSEEIEEQRRIEEEEEWRENSDDALMVSKTQLVYDLLQKKAGKDGRGFDGKGNVQIYSEGEAGDGDLSEMDVTIAEFWRIAKSLNVTRPVGLAKGALGLWVNISNMQPPGAGMPTVADMVKEIVAENGAIDATRITEKSSWVNLGIDSIDSLEIELRLEDEFDIEIPAEDAEKWKTVGDVIDYITQKLDAVRPSGKTKDDALMVSVRPGPTILKTGAVLNWVEVEPIYQKLKTITNPDVRRALVLMAREPDVFDLAKFEQEHSGVTGVLSGLNLIDRNSPGRRSLPYDVNTVVLASTSDQSNDTVLFEFRNPVSAYSRLADLDRTLIDGIHPKGEVRETLAEVYLGELGQPAAFLRLKALGVDGKLAGNFLARAAYPTAMTEIKTKTVVPGEPVATETGAEAPTQALERPAQTGGIDMSAAHLDLQIKRDDNGVPLPVSQQPIQNMRIEGFFPVIINITPAVNLPLLLGINTFKDEPVNAAKNPPVDRQDLSLRRDAYINRSETEEEDYLAKINHRN